MSRHNTSTSKISPIIINARRSESKDVQEIMKMMDTTTKNIFGNINVIHLLEKANLAVTIENEKKEVLAQATFLDYPNVKGVDQSQWETWIRRYSQSGKCTAMNTLFLHLFVTNSHYPIGCIKEIIRTVFNVVRELHHIILNTGKNVFPDPSLSYIFAPMALYKSEPGIVDHASYMCYRQDHVPVLYIRKARIEDHDELNSIFIKHSDTLRLTYGDFFLAELIEAQDDHNHAAVCEVKSSAVGFVSVCSDVNVNLLVQCFDLRPFHNFAKVPRKVESVASLEPDAISGKESTEQSASLEFSKEHLSKQSMPDIEGQVTEESTETITQSVITTEVAQPPNVFCIQLFCINDEYESRSQDFLPYIFDLYPDRDYCVITVPHVVPEFPLLKEFVRITPYSNTTLPHELYIAHRNSLLKCFLVRSALSTDVQGVENLVRPLHLHENIIDNLKHYINARRDFDGIPIQAFVAVVLDEIVGVAIVRNEEDIEYIRSHYNIEDFIYFNHHKREEHGHLYHFAVNPIFNHFSRHFLKEILRLSHKSCLYYPIHMASSLKKSQSPHAHSLTSALYYLIPVRPRRQIIYPLKQLGINVPSKRIYQNKIKYALNHINRKLTLEPKVTINCRIVVVGASEVGISFLETMVLSPHLRFNNITLISTHGIMGPSSRMARYRKFLSTSYSYDYEDLALMALQTWVNVVVGKMIGIDRAAKHVLVTGDRKVSYEHLVICIGHQYQTPCPTGADITLMPTNNDVTVNPDQRYKWKVPSNLLIMNNEIDCQNALAWIKKNELTSKGNIIVYGNSIDTYCTVETLLTIGVSGFNIHLVQPPLKSNITCFNNLEIESAIKAALQKANVSVYPNSILAKWNDGKPISIITSASFTTDTKPFTLPCSVFFSFYPKQEDYDAFLAVNNAWLVYDGKLVIDTTFHTNDATIRAAGPFTKFSRRYYFDQWSHANFNSKQVGFQLASIMLHLFDPTLKELVEPPKELDQLVPMYTGSKSVGGCLPGGYYYLHIAKPGLNNIILEEQRALPSYGIDLITGKAMDGTYFRVKLSQYNMVDSITCLSLKPLPVSNYMCLYQQHERVLNNLHSRFNEGLILDFHSYFNESWCLPIYHDRFFEFKEEVRKIVQANKTDDESIDEMIRLMTENELPTKTPKLFLEQQFQEKGYNKLIERGVLNFLHYNNYHLPMFAWPGIC
eukprot:gi/632961029/ref/XP_007896529.1/ PREDICTED: uncharacterized protein C20orf26 homolog [Callorhinchus milii]